MPTPYDNLTLREKIMIDQWPDSEVEEFGHGGHGEGCRIASGMKWCADAFVHVGRRRCGIRPDPTWWGCDGV